ncbi:MAG: hypothetical protein GY941_00615 [Planctomycetes bacterium]|nr:hypothetical protein [Planctomycetota bacterium]
MKRIMTCFLVSLIFLALGATAALVFSVTGDIVNNIIHKNNTEIDEDF